MNSEQGKSAEAAKQNVRMQPFFTMSRRVLICAVIGTLVAFSPQVGIGGGFAAAGMWIAFAWIYVKEDLARAGLG